MVNDLKKASDVGADVLTHRNMQFKKFDMVKIAGVKDACVILKMD